MKLDELRTVQSKERRKDSLQQLRDSFYEDVAAYLQDLKASRDRRAQTVEDPFSDDEIRRLSDELETAEEVAEAVYERRVGKVVKLASFAAAEMPVDDEGMTSEERRLFDDLVDRISRNKTAVLDVLSGSTDPTPPTETSSNSQPTPASAGKSPQTPPPSADGVLADAMGGESTAEARPHSSSTATETPRAEPEPPSDNRPDDVLPPESHPEPDAVVETTTDGGTTTESSTSPIDDSPASSSTASPTSPTAESTGRAATESSQSTPPAEPSADTDLEDERTTVRITKNVGDIFGVDGREYTLRSEDVVTLPTANAEPLVDRDAAMRLD